MKYFVVVVVLAVVAGAFALTDEQKAKAEQLAGECCKETSTSPDAVKKLKSGDTSDNSSNIQDFATCFFKKVGFFNAAGDLDEKVTVEKLSQGTTADEKTKIEQTVASCKGKQGTNKKAAALALYQCYVANKAL